MPSRSPTHTDREESSPEIALDAGTRREQRAQSQEMDVALLRQGGIYEVTSSSGNVYIIDLLSKSCSCPDDPPSGGCKHYRRVRTDLQAGLVPRPDGKLPTLRSDANERTDTGGDREPDSTTTPNFSDADIHAIRSAEAALVKQQLLTELLARDVKRAHLDREIHDLEFLVEILGDIATENGYVEGILKEPTED